MVYFNIFLDINIRFGYVYRTRTLLLDRTVILFLEKPLCITTLGDQGLSRQLYTGQYQTKWKSSNDDVQV